MNRTMQKFFAGFCVFVGITQLFSFVLMEVTHETMERAPPIQAVYLGFSILFTSFGCMWFSLIRWKRDAIDAFLDIEVLERQIKELQQEKKIRDAVREETRR